MRGPLILLIYKQSQADFERYKHDIENQIGSSANYFVNEALAISEVTESNAFTLVQKNKGCCCSLQSWLLRLQKEELMCTACFCD